MPILISESHMTFYKRVTLTDNCKNANHLKDKGYISKAEICKKIKNNEELAIPTGKYSTNYLAETEALCTAVSTVAENPARTTGKVVIFTDALSVLQALKNSQNKETNTLTTSLQSLSATVNNAVLQWVPAHCCIRGNKKADKLTKDGAQKEQIQSLVHLMKLQAGVNTSTPLSPMASRFG